MKQLLPVLLLCVAGLSGFNASASDEWTLQGKSFTVDTVYHAKIGPGTTQTSLLLKGASRLNLFYTTTDITNPSVDLRVTKGNNAVDGIATLSSMTKSASTADARYFAGVNADFFAGTRPCGATVVNGDPYYAINNGWDCWYMTTEREVGLGRIIFKATASAGGRQHSVTSINGDRGENALVIYTSRKGSNTGTNSYGSEVATEIVEGALGYSGTAKLRVKNAPATAGSMSIGSSVVLSGHGTGRDFVAALAEGDIVEVAFQSEYPQDGNIVQMAGGLPVILSNNVTLDTDDAIDHLPANHPRTAIGYDATATKVVMLVVDGRTTLSAGCSTKALADIMRYLGCTEALNFDGGGSSELYTTSLGVRNNPSDGKERTVCNAVWAVSTSPADNEVAEIQFEYHTTFSMPRYGYFKPVIYAYNKYGDLLSTDFNDFTLSCDSALGTIVDGGSTLFANGTGVHVLTASYGDVTATLPIEIGSAAPEFINKSIILDNNREYSVEVAANVNGSLMRVDNEALLWSSTDEAVVTVDDSGGVRGVSEGTAKVSGCVDTFFDELTVNVQIPTGRYVPVFGQLDDSTFDISKVGVDDVDVVASDEGIVLNYSVKNSRNANVTLTATTDLYALPDSVRFVLEPAGAVIKSLSLSMSAPGQRVTTVVKDLDTKNVEGTTTVAYAISDFVDIADIASYPVNFRYFKFTFGDATGEPRSIGIKKIESVYNYLDDNSHVEDVTFDAEVLTLQRNIVAPGDKLLFKGTETDAVCTIYSMSGMVVTKTSAALLHAPVSSGLYIVKCGSKAQRLIVR